MKHVRRAPHRDPNPWGIRPMANRVAQMAGVTLHETRSGHPDREDGIGAEGWASSFDNARPRKPDGSRPDNPAWCSMWEWLVYEMGTQVEMFDWRQNFAAWTAGWGAKGAGTWPLGQSYGQIEFAHGTGAEPYNAVQIDSGAQLVAELSIEIDFPLVYIDMVTQTEDPKPRGITTHRGSANGIKLGKSDPGRAFPYDEFLALAKEYANPVPSPSPIAELNEAVLRRFELNALVQLQAVERRDVAFKSKHEGWVEGWVERDYVPAALSGLYSYMTMNAAWTWCRQQGYIPNRTI